MQMDTSEHSTIRVGLDVDGVLCDHVAGLCQRIRDTYGIALAPDMITEWDLDFGPNSIVKELELAYERPAFLLALPPVEGAPRAVWCLARRRRLELVAVTSRPPGTREATRTWLQRHFPALALTHSSRKEDLPIDVLVDDFPTFVTRFAARGKLGVLFSRPWNAAEQHRLLGQPGIAIADGWEAVLDLLTSLRPPRVGSVAPTTRPGGRGSGERAI